VIIKDEIRNRVISARSFTFLKDNRNFKIRGRSWWWSRRTTYRKGISRNWFGGSNLWAISVDISEIPNCFWCKWTSSFC